MPALRRPMLCGIFVVTLWVAAGGLAFRIQTGFARLGGPAPSGDVMSRIFGSAKEGIGDALFLKADSYYHGGVQEHFEDSARTLRQEGMIEDDDHDAARSAAPRDWIEAINRRVGVHEHYHLAGAKKNEMLPLLAWAVELDPYNVEAILTAAYWLTNQFGKTDEAVKTLERGIANNPGSWELRSTLADIYFKQKKDYARSAAGYREALERIDRAASPHDAGRVAYYLAESYYLQGKKAEALPLYQTAIKTYGGKEEPGIRETISRKIRELSVNTA